jgi:hypothetical protein
MTDFSKATPRPWRLDREQYVRGKNAEWVGYKEEDAALIVEAVNSYDANKALIAELVAMVQDAYNAGFIEGMKEYTSSKGGKPWVDSKFPAALAKAKAVTG